MTGKQGMHYTIGNLLSNTLLQQLLRPKPTGITTIYCSNKEGTQVDISYRAEHAQDQLTRLGDQQHNLVSDSRDNPWPAGGFIAHQLYLPEQLQVSLG